ncbi:MAG: Holliday junction resolvase RuvX [Chitinophagaceae bacterium]|jgi:putative Holliday junction resolvase|nr:MAG: Holliday junction resolvase RuvX [Chitinophagaceae bacterium]
MPRILAIDYGKKRTGIAVTDPLKMIATGLTTVLTHELIPFLKKYFLREEVEKIIIGYPKNLNDTDTDATQSVRECVRILKKNFPDKPVEMLDERFTSKIALQSIVASGINKKQRRDKGLIDEVSATVLLQDYLRSI